MGISIDQDNFSDRIAEFSEGWLDRELTQRLADLIKAVKVNGKKGSLTLRLDVTPRNEKDGDIVIIRPCISDNTPKVAVDPEVFRAYDDGDLERIPLGGEVDDGLGDDKPAKNKVTPIRGKA